MAEFLWVESSSTQMTEEPRFSRTQFGDGYAQDAPDGLNPITQTWDVSFQDAQDSAASAIVAFFRARISPSSGLEPFDWTPLWSTTKIKVKCTQWSRTLGSVYGESNIQARFVQWFGP